MLIILQGHEEKLKGIDADLQGIKHDILLIDDHESLAGRAVGLEEASFDLQLAIKHLHKTVKSNSTVSQNTGLNRIKLPKISVPTFDGKILN